MRTTASTRRPTPAGFVSYVLVLSTGLMLTLLMFFAYRGALLSQSVQAGVNLQLDYAEKEDNVLRSIVAITPNRAIQAMRSGSDVAGVRETLTWNQIFIDSLAEANAGQSLTPEAMEGLGLGGSIGANPGNLSIERPARVFGVEGKETGPWIRAGINHDYGSGFPPALSSSQVVKELDEIYPIISNAKVYGALAATKVGLPVNPYSRHNIINYPKINFGYASPGEPFVAKRNWWSFSMNLAANDAYDDDGEKLLTGMVRPTRDFVLSIYEIPSQLAISASAFTSIGTHSSGDVWENISVEGNVYASRAHVTGGTVLDSLASRRGMELSSGAVIGGQNFIGNPFQPGVREQFEVNAENAATSDAPLADGGFFPLSLPSESGRAAFVPINRGNTFFDRFEEAAGSNSLSPTTWNNYSIGALQCAMQLDIVECESDRNPTPTILRFSYLKNNVRTTNPTLLPQVTGIVSELPDGYVKVADEHESYEFGDEVVDIAYGANGKFYFQTAVKGTVMFDDARFGNPIVGTPKAGYARPAKPFEVKTLKSGKVCIAFYPERLPGFLTRLGADGPGVNNSLVVNVDYKTSLKLRKPEGREQDYGVILEECADLRPFSTGFSLVTNLRLYIGDDFNIVATTPPSGYSPPGDYYPPCSLFAPEKRYGVEADPYALQLAGQVGSLASEDAFTPVHLLDSIGMSGQPINSKLIRAELSQIRHPADLPPITMMNWLVVLEERRREFR